MQDEYSSHESIDKLNSQKTDFLELAKSISSQNAKPPSKLALWFGSIAWLIVYGGGLAFLVYLVIGLLLQV